MLEPRIDDLNPEQLRAATMGEGPVLTIAGAGTGKTKTLAARVAWLVSQGIDPGRIMLLTFTRRASDEMLRRARRALGETGSRTLGTVWGGTFHSVANRLLRTYGDAIGLDPDFTVMDQSDAEDLLDASRHNLALGSKEKRFPRKQTCLSIYSRCVNSSDRLDHTLAAFFPWCIEWEQELRLRGPKSISTCCILCAITRKGGEATRTHIRQLTRFIPRELKPCFQLERRAQGASQPKITASVRVTDIQKSIRGIWE